MMNKKGLSFGRLILYILFITIIGFIIYSLVLTYKEIKKKEPATQTTTKIEVGPRMAYNNQFQYSGADYISSAYLNVFSLSDIVYPYGVGNFTYSLDTIQLFPPNSSYYNNLGFYTIPNDYVISNEYWSSVYYYDLRNDINDNVFNIASSVSNIYSYNINRNMMRVTPSGTETWNFLTHYYSNSYSTCLVINCDIPLSLFNFSIAGDINYLGADFYFRGDNSNLTNVKFVNNGFHSSDIPSSIVANSTKITQIVFPISQTYSINGLNYYLFSGNLNYGYQNILNGFTANITFDIFTNSTDYQDGYTIGYNEGVAAADAALREYNLQLEERVTSLSTEIDSLNSRIQQQANIITNLQNQLDLQDTNFKGLFFTFADIPFKTMHNALGFEVFGMNLWNFFVGVLTALGIIWLIKKIL